MAGYQILTTIATGAKSVRWESFDRRFQLVADLLKLGLAEAHVLNLQSEIYNPQLPVCHIRRD